MGTLYFGQLSFEVWEFALLPFYFGIIWFVSSWIKNMNIEKHPEYKYYLPGLYAKIIGGIGLALVYLYYYGGGDTTYYFQSGLAFANLIYERPADFLTAWLTPASEENLSFFNYETGYPMRYMYFDLKTFTVIRFIAPLIFITFKSYLLTTILLSWVCYFGVWKLYLLFCRYYPSFKNQLAISILFLPSVIFWGSGILKDTVTFSATCWFVYAFHNVFIVRKNFILNVIYISIAFYFLISIKPYIIYALIPGSLIWIFFEKIKKVKNQIVMFLIIPFIYVLSIAGAFSFFIGLGGVLGEYSPDNILTKAAVTQDDLKQEYYHGSTFDIGTFDASVQGILSKVPIAVLSGIYRPFIWEIENIPMALSGLENLFFLVLSCLILIKIKFFNLAKLFKALSKHPLVFFSLSYSLLFAFGIGLTTANFGALVRFKIPFLPFLIASLFILNNLLSKKSSGKRIGYKI